MYTYTICFIRNGDKILLLNRQSAPWMGCWNGVGGKIEAGETPDVSILREIREETGLQFIDVIDKGVVTWTIDGTPSGGMHLYYVECEEAAFPTSDAKQTEEGILAWKSIDWILHPENQGIASNIHYFLPLVLSDEERYDHHCVFENGLLQEVTSHKLQDMNTCSI